MVNHVKRSQRKVVARDAKYLNVHSGLVLMWKDVWRGRVTAHRQGAESASKKLGAEQGKEVVGWLMQRSEKREESNAINYVRALKKER